tara:strand:- start:180 stop:980 length:801 start_codon:yes stop_codon:yes gene_type:complete
VDIKIGVVYNVFDGEELLEGSIRSIREKVDFIVVLFQTVSNFGNQYEQSKIESEKLLEMGLVDEIRQYSPTIQYMENGSVFWESGCDNEMAKRNYGLDVCRENDCTHLLMMDTDEYYVNDQFEYALKEILDGDFDTSFCQMVTYYKKPTLILSPKEKYYVPFIIKIKPNTEYKLFVSYPYQIDQTRQTQVGNCITFMRDELEMHHFSYVRKDIEKKFINSSSIFPKEQINDVVRHFKNHRKGGRALLLGERIFNTELTDNIFNIEI